MRRFLCLFALCLLWAACGEKSLQVSTPTPAPRPAAPTPAPAPAPAASVVAAPAKQAAAPSQPSDLAVEMADDPDEEAEAELLTDEELLVQRLEEIELEALQRSFSAAELQSPDLPALEAEDGSVLDEIELDAIPEDYDLEQDRETILRNTKSELPLTLNDQVARMINYFSSRGAKTFRVTMGRAAAYRDMIERILKEEGVPVEMIHLAQAESGFMPKARSYARATGMWQFMAFRGKQYGLRQDRYLEERYDIESATRAAARHLKDLEIEFGDWYLAMAAYNSGPGRVRRALQRGGGTRDYWELCRKQLLPRQTRDYVPIILAMTYIAKHPKLYDVGTIDPAPTLRYDTVEVEEEISAELIADATGTTAAEIEQLNQALLRSATPPYRYELRLPPGTADQFLAELATVPSDKRMSWRRHEVGDGDSLAEIAKKYEVSHESLLAVNGLSLDDAALEAGDRLSIPTETKLRLFRGASSGGSGGLVEDGSGRYKIARGDNLGAIARRFGVSVGDLRGWNGLTSSAIRAGRYLIVRPEGVGAPSKSAPDGNYRVARGDTLGKIAARFRTSVKQLQAWNGLTSSRIHVGDVLKVPGAAPATAVSTPTPGGEYRIRPGDSLGSIARRHGVTIADLQQWNGLRGNSIRAGHKLHVSAPSATVAKASESGTTPPSPSSGGAEIRYRIRSGDSLATIASRHGVSIGDLRNWNGLRSSRIRAGETLVIRNQSGSAASTPAPSVASAPAAPRPAASAPSDGRYKIRPGDNLGAIAETFGVTAADLRRWNNMRGSRIAAGKYLIVRPPSSRSSAAESAPAPAEKPVTAAASAQPKVSNPGTYTVRSGDTLGAIADRYGVSVQELRAWNGIRGSRLDIGQKLVTAAPSAGRSSASSGASDGSYRIRPGDTLAVIASRFNVSVKDLMNWNGLKSTRIRAGTFLRVRSDAGGDD